MPHTNFWTDEERLKLRKLVDEGLSTSEMGRRLGRTKGAVTRQLRYLDLTSKWQPREGPGRVVVRTPRLGRGKATLPPLMSLREDK